jgi:oligopeptidase A
MPTCRQLPFGQMDMELHSNYDAAKGSAGEGESIFDVQRRIAAKYTPYNMPLPEDRFLCTFSHIFAGGYASGYYSYKWAEVMSADAFSAFERWVWTTRRRSGRSGAGSETRCSASEGARVPRKCSGASAGGTPPRMPCSVTTDSLENEELIYL